MLVGPEMKVILLSLPERQDELHSVMMHFLANQCTFKSAGIGGSVNRCRSVFGAH